MPSLESLPNEILVHIASSLTAHDIPYLMRTCKRLEEITEPLLWTRLELHRTGFHESSCELLAPPPLIPPSQRTKLKWSGRRHCTNRFFGALHSAHRPKQLAARVKSLCTDIEPLWHHGSASVQGPSWRFLPCFANLEMLELHRNEMSPTEHQHLALDVDAPPLPRLRFAKLVGYIPREVAAWVLRSGPTLERLELGMLDRPISSDAVTEPDYPPLPEEQLANDDSGASDYGSLAGMAVIPRPLGDFLPPDMQLSLPRLKHLHLCQPSETDYGVRDDEYTWSSRAETATFKSWGHILWTSNQTLEILVLEQRPGAQTVEQDGAGSAQFIKQNVDGIGSEALVELMEQLLARQDGFPALKDVYLYGITVGQDPQGRPSASVPGGRLMLALERRGVKCEARVGKWFSFDVESGMGFYDDWTPDYDYFNQDVDDDGDSRWDTLLARV